MQFDWPTPDQIRYRIMRLRRLIAVAVAIPVVAMLGLSFFDPTALSADRATLAAFAVSVLVVAHVVLFPNVAEETISLSLSVTLLVLAMPFIKQLALWAPAEHVTAALILLVAFAVVATGVVMGLLHIMLNTLVHAGPAIGLRLRTQTVLSCSTDVARRQCGLHPETRRGRVLAGPADENGFFEVAVASYQVADPSTPEQPMVVTVDAKVLQSDKGRHDVMIALRNGTVTVTSQEYAAVADGCQITAVDLPGDFTLGMHAAYWLTDQQADNLTELTDVITGQDARANGLAHGISLLSVAGAVFLPKAPVENRAD
ncbi:MAG: hypothetical protein AAFU41_07075 [Pseudomonadota bacterium]